MTEKLSTYKSKRDPNRTPEPMGSTVRKDRDSARTFVIQEHHASSLHWDFRLERDGVLVSWALPKGLPIEPKHNHLAVHTEDHPLDYATFEGTIPKGEYGGGHVSIWDHGTYQLEKWTDREVKVVLKGSKSAGRYVLFPTHGKNWMIHRMDAAPPDFEEMPTHIKPMLALAGELPVSDDGWAYEFKWDGVRATLFVDGGRVRAFSRNDNDLMKSFPELKEIGLFLGSRKAILDGEIVSFDQNGRPSFSQLQSRLHVGSRRAASKKETVAISFLAFDLLYLEGQSLVQLPYDERRKTLEKLKLAGKSFATPPAATGVRGKDILAIARDQGLEGVVAKRRNAPYSSGQRNGAWIKIKNFLDQEVIIAGWTDGNGERSGSLGALLLAVPTKKGLTYVGKVGTGFSAHDRDELLKLLSPIATTQNPFGDELTPAEISLAHFVKPKIVGEVRYAEMTPDGHLRHASWRGLRTDKSSKDVRRE